MNIKTIQLHSIILLSALTLAMNTHADDELHAGAAASNASVSTELTNADPWQGYNRSMFAFNTVVDNSLFKPLAKGYVWLTPEFFRQGVSNVFANILEVPSVFNGVLQGKFSHAAHDGGRLLINSTLGLVGIFDVAQHMGLKNIDGEDFGQTLAVWGVGSGPYVVLPFLGGSTLRDTAALPMDFIADPKSYIQHVPTSNSTMAMSLIDMRAGFLPLEKVITGDRYTFIRDAYLQRRHFVINDGLVEDSFGVEESGDGDYGY